MSADGRESEGDRDAARLAELVDGGELSDRAALRALGVLQHRALLPGSVSDEHLGAVLAAALGARGSRDHRGVTRAVLAALRRGAPEAG